MIRMVAHTKLSEKEIISALKAYNIGRLESFRFLENGIENTNISVMTAKGNYVLRMIEKKRADILFQAELLLFLEHKQIKAPELIPATDGRPLSYYRGKPVFLFEFVKGSHPGKINDALFEDIIKEAAKLQLTLLLFRPKNAYRKYFTSELDFFDNIVEKYDLAKYKVPLAELREEMDEADFSSLRKGIIHGDIHKYNLLCEKGKLKCILDFDDANYDYFANEAAIFIFYFFSKGFSFDKRRVNKFLKKYYSLIGLSAAEKKSVLVFLKRRALAGAILFEELVLKKKGDVKYNKRIRTYFWRRFLDLKRFTESDFEV